MQRNARHGKEGKSRQCNARQLKPTQGNAMQCHAMQCNNNAAMQCATAGWNALRIENCRYTCDLGSHAKLICGPARSPGSSTILGKHGTNLT
eukprot:scaffold165555_cov38-Prasinocladus_malaysianus.AAC.2